MKWLISVKTKFVIKILTKIQVVCICEKPIKTFFVIIIIDKTLFQTYRCLQFNCPVPHRHHCWSPHLKPLHQRRNLRPRHLLHAVECPAHLLPYPRRGRENPSDGSARARTLNLVHHRTLTSLSGELFHQQ